jgi:hypothetical protein
LIENLGSTFVYFVFLVAALLSVPLLSLSESLAFWLKRLSQWVKNHMIWNFTLRFLIQQAPPISIACGINLFLLVFNKFDGSSISSFLSLAFLVILGLSKFIVFAILKKH